MSGYPPQPPDQQQYNAFLDSAQQEQLQFGTLSQQIYPAAKVEDVNRPYSPSAQILAQELHNANLNDTPQQQLLQAAQQQSTSIDQSGTEQQLHTHEGTSDSTPKPIRLRKACDSCSIRKVKCDESGPPCKACASLDIPCTFDRPSRRRGPPNKHADAIKRRRLEDGNAYVSATPAPDPSSSPTHAAQALAALSSRSGKQDSAESICSLDTLDFLIEDFFRHIYPLYPFPHESSFREAWKGREDRVNKTFLALLCAMTGALLTSLPRKARLYLTAQRQGPPWRDFAGLAHRCQHLCVTTRGLGHAGMERLNVYDAATSFFLALMGSHRQNAVEHQYYLGECLNILRSLELQKTNPSSRTDQSRERLSSDDSNITIEMGRRIFWAALIHTRSIEQTDRHTDPPIPLLFYLSRPHAPLPTEADDFCIYPDHTEPQPDGLLPLVAGFNAVARVFESCDTRAASERVQSSHDGRNLQRQASLEASRKCRDVLVNLPPELRILSIDPSSGSPVASSSKSFISAFNQPMFLREPDEAWADPPVGHLEVQPDPQERRENQYKAQRVALYAATIKTRHYLVSSYWSLREADTSLPAHNAADDEEMVRERDDVERDILLVLGSMDYVNTGPNADLSNAMIRSIARRLVNQPEDQKGQLALQSGGQILAFLDSLSQLEDPANGDGDADSWARVKELQLKFANPDSYLVFHEAV